MGIDIKALQEKAIKGELKLSTADSGNGGGPKAGAGVFTVKPIGATIEEGMQSKKKQLVVKLEVVDAIEVREPEVGDGIGGSFRWYFVQADKADWEERLVADLVGMFKELDLDPSKLFEDADTLLDIYTNVSAALAKPIARGTVGTFNVERVRQAKNPKNFNHALVIGEVKPKAAATSRETDGL